ncbi:MAG: hypothetical protein K2Y29_16555 [Beijerinckiaceae bacterium]|nr:hypothetical protein [Beijerinckiaceae bacterium]
MTLAPDRHAHAGHDDHAHAHDHGHEHDHAHDHPSHDHTSAARRAEPGLSLLRMSALQRLAIALALVAAIWLGVAWAWS